MEQATKELVLSLCKVLDDKKAVDIKALYVADKTIVAEWFVVCSGRSSVQVKTLCDELEDKAASLGLDLLRKEGYNRAGGSCWTSAISWCISSIQKSGSITI